MFIKFSLICSLKIFSVKQHQLQIARHINEKKDSQPQCLSSSEWREHDNDLDEVIRLSKEDLKNLNSEEKLKEIYWTKERLKEKRKEGYLEDSEFVEEPKLRRRKSKLERQNRCVSEDSNKLSRKETFTLADLQEEMKR